MKKISTYFIVFAVFIVASITGVFLIGKAYEGKINTVYNDKIGDELLVEKNQGLILQQQSLSKKDNFLIYGSSELSTLDIPTHPSHMFNDKADGFQINLIGRGHSQSIIHAINLGALSKELQNKKVAIIISPQWFTEKGLEKEYFPMNFSELQFYTLMLDSKVDSSIKLKLAERVRELTFGNETSKMAYKYAKLYSDKNFAAEAELTILKPYYQIKKYMLSAKDKKDSLKAVNSSNKQNTNAQLKSFNWDKELKTAEDIGVSKANNNEFLIENSYYNKYIKDNLQKDKGAYKGQSYLNSPEYEDLEILLKICKDQNIKPIFISVPVHGKWYDYSEFPKEDRAGYYKKVTELITSYGFPIADLSGYEYEQYFLKDIMHLGWKGWVYVDQAIDKYYHSN